MLLYQQLLGGEHEAEHTVYWQLAYTLHQNATLIVHLAVLSFTLVLKYLFIANQAFITFMIKSYKNEETCKTVNSSMSSFT